MNRSRPHRIVLAEPYDEAAVARLREVGEVSVLEDSAPDTIIGALAEADALLVRTKAHVTARIINAAPHLKVIARASPNIDHIDVRAARQRNISIVYAPHVAIASTAEFTLALILAVSRRVMFYDRQLRDGKFDAVRGPSGREASHLTIGLLGIDPIADRLGKLWVAAFGSNIIYHDPEGRQPDTFQGREVDLETLLNDSDVLSVHLPFSPSTRTFLNAERIAKLKPTACVVNTSRGAVVDTTALAIALRKRHLAGAALDVFETEPLPISHPIRSAPNCILTPHVAGSTLDASASRFDVADDVVRILKGEPPQHAVE